MNLIRGIVAILVVLVLIAGAKEIYTAFEDIEYGWLIWVGIAIFLYLTRNTHILK